MLRKAMIMLVVFVLLPATQAFATVTCTKTNQVDPNSIEVTITSDHGGGFTGSMNETLVNAGRVFGAGCLPFVGSVSCVITLNQTAPGPASWSADISDADGTTMCAFDNSDGLPVELISFSIE